MGLFATRTRLLLISVLGLFVWGCAPVVERTTDVVGTRTVVALLPDAKTSQQMRKVALAGGYTPVDETRLNGLRLTMLTLERPADVTSDQAIEQLEGAVPGSTVGINHAYRVQQGAAGKGDLDYANDLMGWDKNGCVARAPVGVIDTGIDTNAPQLAGTRIVTRSFFKNPVVATEHGTQVASVLANPTRLRGVKIYGANVFGQRDALGVKAGADALVRALDWLAEEDVRFVNLALAGPYNKILELAVERAVGRGLILVAAVGNDGPSVAPRYPAGFDDVIAVTAVDATGRLYRNAVRGPHVDVAGPGVEVLVPSGSGIRFVTGTSIATPFVTARLAADPSLSAVRSVSQVRARLAATSAELGIKGRDPMFGYGLTLARGVCGD